VKKDGYVYLATREAIDNVFLPLLDEVQADQRARIKYGFDCEWNQGSDITYTASFSVDNHPAYVVDLYSTAIFTEEDFPESMKNFLENPKMIPTTRNVHVDVKRMANLGVAIKEWVELGGCAKLIDPDMKKTGLDDLSERFLQLAVDKHGQDADWTLKGSDGKLLKELQEYAAIDPIVSRLLLKRMKTILRERGKLDGSNMIEALPGLQEGMPVEYQHRGRTRASGTIVFVGGNGQARKWGTLTVGSKKAIIKLTGVTCQSTKPPYSFEAGPGTEEGVESWDKKDKTLADVLAGRENPEIAVNTASLLVPLAGGQNAIDDFYTPLVPPGQSPGDAPGDAQRPSPSPSDPPSDTQHPRQSLSEPPSNVQPQQPSQPPSDPPGDPMDVDEPSEHFLGPLVLELDDDDDDDTLFPRSRGKEDIFHQFQDLPLGKICPARPFVSEMLIYSTFRMDEERFKGYKAHLAEKKGIVLTADLMRDFIHNREAWRRHIPMFTPRADEHASMIEAVHSVIQSDSELKKHYTPELRSYFESFALKARKGLFEELEDVILHEQVGHDKYGLPIFIRKRGTVRAENIHQKMKVSIGPWGIGARSSHYLLLLLSYRYNVSSGIRRKGDHNFGHFELYLIDRIQIRIREIYNVIIYPLHQNLMEFKPIDMASVGIVPLSYDSDYVEEGEPDESLKGDLKFLAERLRLVLPLLPIATKEEIKLFTEFMMSHPNPTDSNFKALAKLFKEKADGKTIFPKLPSMIKSHYNRWKKNQEIKASRENVGSAAKDLRKKLFMKFTCAEESHPSELIEAAAGRERDATTAAAAPAPERQPDEAPAVHTHVPPLVAPSQKNYVPAHVIVSERRCAWWPFCNKTINVCGGSKMHRCRFRDDFNNVSDEELEKAKREAKNEEMRLRARQRQEQKVAARQGEQAS